MATVCDVTSRHGHIPGLAWGGGTEECQGPDRGLVTYLRNRLVDFVHFLQENWYGGVE